MLKISSAGCLGLFLAISSQFTLKLCAAAKNWKKITKTPILGVQDRSRSSMLTNLQSLSPVLVMISSMSVPICNFFYTKRANNGKITSFRGTPLWCPRSRKTPTPRSTKFCHKRTKDFEAAHAKDFMILACFVLTQYRSVTDERTDRRTDTSTMAKTSETFCCHA